MIVWLLQAVPDGTDTTPWIIGMLVTAIASLSGFVYFLFRSNLARADKRIDTLETRESQTLDQIAKNVESIVAMTASIVEAFKESRQTNQVLLDAFREIRQYITWNRGNPGTPTDERR